jgi:hypothetical protein
LLRTLINEMPFVHEKLTAKILRDPAAAAADTAATAGNGPIQGQGGGHKFQGHGGGTPPTLQIPSTPDLQKTPDHGRIHFG